jgi:hypothetical protein
MIQITAAERGTFPLRMLNLPSRIRRTARLDQRALMFSANGDVRAGIAMQRTRRLGLIG